MGGGSQLENFAQSLSEDAFEGAEVGNKDFTEDRNGVRGLGETRQRVFRKAFVVF